MSAALPHWLLVAPAVATTFTLSHARSPRGRRPACSPRAGDAPPATLRQTHLVVIPNCAGLADFTTFDRLVRAINQARRAARDYVLPPKEGEDPGWS